MRLLEWELETKVSMITLDNCSTNDRTTALLKDRFSNNGVLSLNGLFFHVHCCAYVLNLIAQYGLYEVKDVIDKVCEAIKYINISIT